MSINSGVPDVLLSLHLHVVIHTKVIKWNTTILMSKIITIFWCIKFGRYPLHNINICLTKNVMDFHETYIYMSKYFSVPNTTAFLLIYLDLLPNWTNMVAIIKLLRYSSAVIIVYRVKSRIKTEWNWILFFILVCRSDI